MNNEFENMDGKSISDLTWNLFAAKGDLGMYMLYKQLSGEEEEKFNK